MSMKDMLNGLKNAPAAAPTPAPEAAAVPIPPAVAAVVVGPGKNPEVEALQQRHADPERPHPEGIIAQIENDPAATKPKGVTYISQAPSFFLLSEGPKGQRIQFMNSLFYTEDEELIAELDQRRGFAKAEKYTYDPHLTQHYRRADPAIPLARQVNHLRPGMFRNGPITKAGMSTTATVTGRANPMAERVAHEVK